MLLMHLFLVKIVALSSTTCYIYEYENSKTVL